MSDVDLALRYPIGKLSFVASPTAADRAAWIAQIAAAPAKLSAAVRGLSTEQLATPYRDGGWTLAQVVHHLVDSHANAYLRMKFVVTEDGFTVKPYSEKVWAALPDASSTDIAASLATLAGLHARWTTFLSSLDEAPFLRAYQHPESGAGTLDKLVQIYAWHGDHHVAHITTTRARHGW